MTHYGYDNLPGSFAVKFGSTHETPSALWRVSRSRLESSGVKFLKTPRASDMVLRYMVVKDKDHTL